MRPGAGPRGTIAVAVGGATGLGFTLLLAASHFQRDPLAGLLFRVLLGFMFVGLLVAQGWWAERQARTLRDMLARGFKTADDVERLRRFVHLHRWCGRGFTLAGAVVWCPGILSSVADSGRACIGNPACRRGFAGLWIIPYFVFFAVSGHRLRRAIDKLPELEVDRGLDSHEREFQSLLRQWTEIHGLEAAVPRAAAGALSEARSDRMEGAVSKSETESRPSLKR